MLKDYNQSVEINRNPNWPFIPDHPYRILIIGYSGSRKTGVLLNLMKNQKAGSDKFICMSKSIRIKVSIAYQKQRKSRN